MIIKVILNDPSDRTAHSVLGGVIGELETAAVVRAYKEIVAMQPRFILFLTYIYVFLSGGVTHSQIYQQS
jgi:hypothetical protein